MVQLALKCEPGGFPAGSCAGLLASSARSHSLTPYATPRSPCPCPVDPCGKHSTPEAVLAPPIAMEDARPPSEPPGDRISWLYIPLLPEATGMLTTEAQRQVHSVTHLLHTIAECDARDHDRPDAAA